MVCCVIFRILLFNMGMHKCSKNYWQLEQSGSENRSGTFPLLGFQTLLYCNFVLYEVKRCVGSSSHVHAWNFFGAVYFHLGTWTMFQNIWPNFLWVSLLFEGFETSVLCLSWTTLWEGGSNIVDWQWTYQSVLES